MRDSPVVLRLAWHARTRQRVLVYDYGYSQWIGPEPHGCNGLDSGSSAPHPKKSRDVKIIDQTIELFSNLDSDKPWYT